MPGEVNIVVKQLFQTTQYLYSLGQKCFKADLAKRILEHLFTESMIKIFESSRFDAKFDNFLKRILVSQ